MIKVSVYLGYVVGISICDFLAIDDFLSFIQQRIHLELASK